VPAVRESSTRLKSNDRAVKGPWSYGCAVRSNGSRVRQRMGAHPELYSSEGPCVQPGMRPVCARKRGRSLEQYPRRLTLNGCAGRSGPGAPHRVRMEQTAARTRQRRLCYCGGVGSFFSSETAGFDRLLFEWRRARKWTRWCESGATMRVMLRISGLALGPGRWAGSGRWRTRARACMPAGEAAIDIE
jgi:hypothetical protein